MAEADSKDKPAAKKVFDVSGSPTATPSSKPIILSHGPVINDPTIVNEDKPDAPPDEAEAKPMNHELKIQPLGPIELDKPEAEAKNVDEKPSPEPESEAKSEPAAKPKPDKVETQTKEPASISQPDSAVNDNQPAAADSQSKADKEKEEQKLAEAEAAAKKEHDDHIDQLVSSEKFFLPINRQEKRRNQHAVLIGVFICLLLAVAWLDIALDAGLISNSLHLPHTHFFALKH